MNSLFEHNKQLQEAGSFSAEDLNENRQGRLSPSQVKRFEDQRNYVNSTAPKYDNKGWVISIIFGIGLCLFTVVIYFFGVFDILQKSLGGLFLPVMAGAALLAALFVFVIVPRQYQSSVEMYKSMGTPLAERPLGAIQVIDAQADAYESRAGIDRRGRQSSQVSYILQMESIKFRVSQSLMKTIQPKRQYRAYAVNDQGAWTLLSIETLE
jgi:hypothetical protein